jgi:tRNA-specific 2-thiouridylase
MIRQIKAKTKVFVGMSGGVDSSVSAALLKDQGYDVTGVFIKVWHPEFMPCEWKAERRDAIRVCAHLGIPFLTLDCEKEYKKEVVDYMIDEYKNGRTPNPDVMCNKSVKFGSFYKKSLEMGADFVATGHYSINKIENGKNSLFESKDKNKDQSYFLWTLTEEQLNHCIFPVGDMTKDEVRKIAEKKKIPTAQKKDSQGLCFIGKVDMKDFLKHYLSAKEGKVLDINGEIIGRHDGAYFYTIGQRHGFTIDNKVDDEKPLYIIEKNINKNTITVSNHFEEIENARNVKAVEISNTNWINGIQKQEIGYLARFRYRQEPQRCSIEVVEDKTIVHFRDLQSAVSLGQSLVLYSGEKCLGGGIIEKTSN